MTRNASNVAAVSVRPVDGLRCPADVARCALTVAEAELRLRRVAASVAPGTKPRRVEATFVFADGARKRRELALTRDGAHCETALLDDVLLGWASEERAGGDNDCTAHLARQAELVRHVAHNRAVSERVEVYERLRDDVDAAGAARRARVLSSPPPAAVVGARYREGRPLELVAHDVRHDVDAAIGDGTLPAGLRCTVRIEPFEEGPGIEIEVVHAPRLWIPDVCEMCLPAAYGLEPPDKLTCGHTPSRTAHSLAADGVLLTLLAIGDVYNRDEGSVENGDYRVESAFVLATCFDGSLARAQRDKLRSSDEALRERAARRRDATTTAAGPPSLPPGPAEQPRTGP
jgi:hypothetical protein